jgi:hypothetical protein
MPEVLDDRVRKRPARKSCGPGRRLRAAILKLAENRELAAVNPALFELALHHWRIEKRSAEVLDREGLVPLLARIGGPAERSAVRALSRVVIDRVPLTRAEASMLLEAVAAADVRTALSLLTIATLPTVRALHAQRGCADAHWLLELLRVGADDGRIARARSLADAAVDAGRAAGVDAKIVRGRVGRVSLAELIRVSREWGPRALAEQADLGALPPPLVPLPTDDRFTVIRSVQELRTHAREMQNCVLDLVDSLVLMQGRTALVRVSVGGVVATLQLWMRDGRMPIQEALLGIRNTEFERTSPIVSAVDAWLGRFRPRRSPKLRTTQGGPS